MRFTLNNITLSDIKNKEILDIGCGFGWCELDFIKKGAKRIVGIELSEEDLLAARKSVKSNNVEFMVGSGIDIPLKDKSVNTVVCFEVIEHIPKNTEVKLFKEINRVLKKGGTLYLSTPYDNPVTKYLDPAWWLIGHRHYSKDKLGKYGKAAKLEVKTMQVKGGLWSVFGLLYMYVAKWVLRTRTSNLLKLFEEKEELEYQTDGGNGIANIFVTYVKR